MVTVAAHEVMVISSVVYTVLSAIELLSEPMMAARAAAPKTTRKMETRILLISGC